MRRAAGEAGAGEVRSSCLHDASLPRFVWWREFVVASLSTRHEETDDEATHPVDGSTLYCRRRLLEHLFTVPRRLNRRSQCGAGLRSAGTHNAAPPVYTASRSYTASRGRAHRRARRWPQK